MSVGRLLLILLTLVAFAMAAMAVFVQPPPLWVPLSFGAIYIGVIIYGVLNLQLRMFGDAICEGPGAQGKVALTFDDGPDPVSTRHVLTLLKEAGAQATFFVVGKKAEKHPGVLREIVEQGHALGVHSYQHERLYSLLPPEMVKRDIERTREIIERACDKRPIWFRPPVGQMSPRTAAGVERAQATVIGWNVRARDGLKKTTPDECFRRVSGQLEDGAIVLLHDAWEFDEVSPVEDSLSHCPAGVRALERLLHECSRRGIAPVTIDQLLESST